MYKAISTKSNTEIFDQIMAWGEVTKFFSTDNAQAVVWYYDKIEFYQIVNGAWDRPYRESILDEVVRVRIFNRAKEVHVWRSNNRLKGRLRIDDGDGEDIEYVRANQVMNGTKFEAKNGFLVATEEKGIHYELPFSRLVEHCQQIERLAVVTRNYIGYNDIGQAGYIDCRFEEIKSLNR